MTLLERLLSNAAGGFAYACLILLVWRSVADGTSDSTLAFYWLALWGSAILLLIASLIVRLIAWLPASASSTDLDTRARLRMRLAWFQLVALAASVVALAKIGFHESPQTPAALESKAGLAAATLPGMRLKIALVVGFVAQLIVAYDLERLRHKLDVAIDARGVSPSRLLRATTPALLAIALGWAWSLGAACSYLSLVFVASLLCLRLYAIDKAAAEAKTTRTRESRLHLVEALGGWPGALLASQLFRHKTEKKSYRRAFAGIVLLHVAVVGGLCYWGWRTHH